MDHVPPRCRRSARSRRLAWTDATVAPRPAVSPTGRHGRRSPAPEPLHLGGGQGAMAKGRPDWIQLVLGLWVVIGLVILVLVFVRS